MGVQDFNYEFSGPDEEKAFRQTLEVGGVQHVEYRQNRAAVFVSDLFHVSEPFDFPDSVEAPRVNLTLLFGDRTAARKGLPCQNSDSVGSRPAAVEQAGTEK